MPKPKTIPSTMNVRLYVAKVGGMQVARALQNAAERPIERRNMGTANRYIRLEHAEERDGMYLADFVNCMTTSPVRVNWGTEVDPLRYGPGQWPGNEVAMLFVPDTNHILVQAGRVSVNQISNYIRWVGGNRASLVIEPVPNKKVLKQFKRAKQKRVKKLVLSVDPEMLAEDERVKRNRSVTGMVASGLRINAGRINVEYIEPKGVSPIGLAADATDFVNTVADAFWRRPREDSQELLRQESKDRDGILHGVSKAQVHFDADQQSEVLDLLKLLIEKEFPLQMDETEKRCQRAERFRVLLKAHEHWQSLLQRG